VKFLNLTNSSLQIIIDDSDYEFLSQFKWRLNSHGYPTATFNSQATYLHTILLGNHRPYKDVDHINRDKLDNRRSNLRICLIRENSRNRCKIKRTASSVFKGVYWNKHARKWTARIRKDYQFYFIGNFDQENHAALAYDLWATLLFGKFAYTNFPLVGGTNA
jgi:hypothetical protein